MRAILLLATTLALVFAWVPQAVYANAPAPQMVLQVYPPADTNSISPDGRLLADSWGNGHVTIWDLRTGTALGSISLKQSVSPDIVAFSPDSRKLAIYSGSDGQISYGDVSLYDVGSRRLIRSFSAKMLPEGMVFSPDGKTLAVSNGGAVSLWDYRKGIRLRSFMLHPSENFSHEPMAFSPDGLLLATATNGFAQRTSVEIWEVRTGIRRQSIDPANPVASLAFSPDGKTLAMGGDNSYQSGPLVQLWDVAGARIGPVFNPTSNNKATVLAFDSNDDEITVVVNHDSFLHWHPATGKWDYEPGGKGRPPSKWPSNGASLAVVEQGDGTLQVESKATGALLRAIPGNPLQFSGAPFWADNQTLFQSGGLRWVPSTPTYCGEIAQWDLATGVLRNHILLRSVSQANVFARTSPTQVLLGGSFPLGGTDRILTLNLSERSIKNAAQDRKNFGPCALSPDGRLIAADYVVVPRSPGAGQVSPKFYIGLYDSRTGKLVQSKKIKNGFIPVLQFLPGDALQVADKLEVWNVAVGGLRYKIATIGLGEAISGDGRTIAAPTSRNTVDIYSLATARRIRSIPAAPNDDASLVLSSTGRLLAIHCADGLVRVWNVAKGRLESAFDPKSARVSMSFSPDGRVLACAGDSGALTIWNTRQGRLRATLLAFDITENNRPKTYWLAYTPACDYEGSPGVERFIRWRVNGVVQASSKIAARRHRPSLVQNALSGHSQPARYAGDLAEEGVAGRYADKESDLIAASMAPKYVPLPAPKNPTERLRDDLGYWSYVGESNLSQDARIMADLAAGADPNTRTKDGSFALGQFVDEDNVEGVKWLIAHKANLNGADRNEDTVLLDAAEFGYTDIVQLLLDAGATFKDSAGHDLLALRGNQAALNAALMNAIKWKEPPGYTGYPPDASGRAYLLVLIGANPNSRDEDGDTAMMDASAYLSYGPIFPLMLAKGADVSAKNKVGETPLLLACQFDMQPLVKLLLDHGANANQPDSRGYTPMIQACSGEMQSIPLLLDHGANPNVVEPEKKDGRSPLIYAAEQGFLNIAATLVAHGADVNVPEGYDHRTALAIAVDGLDATMVRLLLAHGADVNVRDKDGKSLLQIDKEQDPSDSYGIAALLRKAGAK